MRISNINTLSSFFDRLITERIKHYFFKKEGQKDKVKHQEIVIKEIKKEIIILLKECITKEKYDYLGEKRTFDENSIVEELEELIHNDINIGESDRLRLAECTSDNPNLKKMVTNEKRLRKSNEGRAKNKNNIDQIFSKLVDNEE